MSDSLHSIIEKLAILEGRISPASEPVAETKQKKPALFNNLKKKDESAIPMVGGVEFAEGEMKEDILGKVKASLADYLQAAEEEIKQDKDLLAKKKQDLDLKKKELKDLDLQAKELKVKDSAGELELDEEPNQAPPTGEAPAGLTDPTYAQGGTSTYAESAPVKTVNVELQEMGGSVLVEIHGDEREGFTIRRAGRELPTRFKSLEECEIALEMFMARRKAQQELEQSADYLEEK